MFDELVISSGQKTTNKSWTVVVYAIIQAGLLGILVLLPLIYTEALPKQLLIHSWWLRRLPLLRPLPLLQCREL
jgi:hypothetical protein